MSRQKHYRENEQFEKADPNPVAYMEPLPPLAAQVRAALLADPGLVKAWHEQERLEANDFEDMDFDEPDPDPDMLSGYELVHDLVEEFGLPEAERAPNRGEPLAAEPNPEDVPTSPKGEVQHGEQSPEDVAREK